MSDLARIKPCSKTGDVHVMPEFGKRHEESIECWCQPRALPDTMDREIYRCAVWVHEPEN